MAILHRLLSVTAAPAAECPGLRCCARIPERRRLQIGIFDGLVGGIVGVIDHVLHQNGGVQGVVNHFERNGLGPTVRSWVGTGVNQRISQSQLQQAAGSSELQERAQKAGMAVPELAARLMELLPQAVDRLTPNGVVPKR